MKNFVIVAVVVVAGLTGVAYYTGMLTTGPAAPAAAVPGAAAASPEAAAVFPEGDAAAGAAIRRVSR